MSKREAAAGLLHWSGAGSLSLVWQRILGRREKLAILAYHRVAEPEDGFGFLDEELISATPAQFDEQISYLTQHYHLTTFSQLQKAPQEKQKLSPLSVIITFDDGYRDVWDAVWPILRKHKAQAVVFLATDYITSGELFWWDKVYYCLKQTSKDKLSLKSRADWQPLPLTTDTERHRAKTKLIQYLKQAPDGERRQILDELAAETGVKVALPPDWRPTLTWAEVRKLSRKGLEFGAHTMTHPILTQLSDEALARELQGSRHRISEETGQAVVSFCYPVGIEGAYDERVRGAVERCGFKFAVVAGHGVNNMSAVDPLALRRLRVAPRDSLLVFKQKLLFPQWIRY